MGKTFGTEKKTYTPLIAGPGDVGVGIMNRNTRGRDRVDEEGRALDHVALQVRDVQNSGLIHLHISHVAAIGETAHDVAEGHSIGAETEEEENQGEDEMHLDGDAARAREVD